MKKIITILATLAFTLSATAQNQEIMDFFRALAAETGNVTLNKRNDYQMVSFFYQVTDSTTDYSISKAEAEGLLANSLPHAPHFGNLMSKAKKFYHYEAHNDDTDTVKFAIAISDNKSNVFSASDGIQNTAEYYTTGYYYTAKPLSGNAFNINSIECQYYYEEPNAGGVLKGAARRDDVHGTLQSFLDSYKGRKVKTYDVHYEFSANYDINKSRVPLTIGWINWEGCLTEGKHYFIPVKGDELLSAYKQLSDKLNSFAESNRGVEFHISTNLDPTKKIERMENSKSYSFDNLMELSTHVCVSSAADSSDVRFDNYKICVSIDTKGFHILEIESTKPTCYYPIWWINIKWMKDDEYKWEKEFKLDYEF